MPKSKSQRRASARTAYVHVANQRLQRLRAILTAEVARPLAHIDAGAAGPSGLDSWSGIKAAMAAKAGLLERPALRCTTETVTALRGVDYPRAVRSHIRKLMSALSADPPAKVPVWDVPLRVFHWLLVGAIAASWWTAENGQLQYHRYSGYTLLGLLVFRIYWGFAGSTTARFSHFVRSPTTALEYIATTARTATQARPLGHNPAGGWSVLLMLGLLAVQIGLGLVAVDVDGLESGPLSHWVSFDTGRTCAELHETVFDLLLAMIAIHLLVVLFYLLYRRENLITPMITGVGVHSGEAQASVYFGSAARIFIGVALAAVTVWMVARGFQL
jgi:cytochrome b